ncbi:MAG: hypothetical protein HY367_00165 [Candidatus Aenigmarchaeota archaeon]|nr:hypothetical protein [Candidatus Aenigmarchaeota archaeon]
MRAFSTPALAAAGTFVIIMLVAYLYTAGVPQTPQVALFCPACPAPSAWGSCGNFTEARTAYACSSSTGYQCVPKGEERSCIPADEEGKYILREYEWSFRGKEFAWRPVFAESAYGYYKNKPRPPTGDYSIYATDPYDDNLITELVSVFREAAQENGFSSLDTVNFVVEFVQSLPYTPDNVTTAFDEYPRYPMETLVDDGGDCEDTSILMSTILQELGYDAVLISPPGHMAVGVACTDCQGSYFEHQGVNYYYVETTGEGWEIGEIPTEYEGTRSRIYALVPRPIITFTWNSDVVGNSLFEATYKVTVDTKNQGSGTADNLHVWVGFDTTEEGKVYSQLESDPKQVEASGELTTTATLDVPKGVYTRLHIVVSGNNFSSKEDVSEWFRT